MEIRFRVWDGEKMWYPGNGDVMQGAYMLTMDGSVAQYRESVGDTCIESYIMECDSEDGYVSMLSTGLKDENGKEIWAGDVVRTPYNDVYDFAHYLIIWSEEKAAFYTECLALHHREDGLRDISRGGYCVGYAWDFASEILGNQYENPELLKEVA